MQRKLFLTILSIFFISSVSSANSVSQETQFEDQAKAFVKQVAGDIITILKNKQQPLAQRKEKFRVELRRNFAMGAISVFAAGRFYRTMTEEQKETYRKLFFDAVVENYASQFDDYNNENFSITGALPLGSGGLLVEGKINRPGKGEPINVQWKIYKTKDRGLKVTDIILDNVSMAQTLRNEYANVIVSRGIEGLLDYLRSKISQDQSGK